MCGAQSTAFLVCERRETLSDTAVRGSDKVVSRRWTGVRNGDGYGAVAVAAEKTPHSKVGRPTESDLALQHNEVNIFGAWRLAALGSGDSSGYTGDLSVRRQKAHGNRGLLRWVAGETLPYVGWVRRMETLHTGGLGRVLLRQVYFFDLF